MMMRYGQYAMPLTTLADVKLLIVKKTGSNPYQIPIYTSSDGRVQGGGTGYANYSYPQAYVEIRNLESEPRAYWMQFAEYESVEERILSQRFSYRSQKLLPGEATRVNVEGRTMKEFDGMILEEFQVINSSDNKVVDCFESPTLLSSFDFLGGPPEEKKQPDALIFIVIGLVAALGIAMVAF
ncbi:hypothetical protein [Sphingomonas sp. G-3-2-10]|uniref:hypothetical protein n=1 Tax=Sphingomonas sp. G-3-2-10 TaxID=2728838 RepID=UPI00146EEF8E|nr:hypothetical protein [Sphingomonas sp. G-3-2-10]NML05970.1 hypothetical protein [Sphingomonas sp. G-3-2-10]